MDQTKATSSMLSHRCRARPHKKKTENRKISNAPVGIQVKNSNLKMSSSCNGEKHCGENLKATHMLVISNVPML